jgi:hypothetical protein
MNKNIFLIFIVFISILFFTNCVYITEETIVGEWKETLIGGVYPPNEPVYYKFKNNDKYISWDDADFPSDDSLYIDYSIINGKLTVGSITYDAYISCNTMYWYLYNIEFYRFERQ